MQEEGKDKLQSRRKYLQNTYPIEDIYIYIYIHTYTHTHTHTHTYIYIYIINAKIAFSMTALIKSPEKLMTIT